MALEIDSLLRGRYLILEELGRGGMGAVYRAVDQTLNVEVAIKENLSTSPEAERQFRREANLLAQLKHPNLPRVTDHFSIDGQGQYLVMDFVPGHDAKRILEQAGGQLDITQSLEWGVALLSALHYLHTRTPPVIHRDIKPSNIKITPDNEAVLVDFGLAKTHDLTQTTTVGAKMLTPGFAPPEQYDLESSRTDPRTDLYSLGATLYNLLCGQMPEDSLDRMVHHKPLTPLRERRPDVPPDVAGAIERALALKPDDRWQTARDFREALQQSARQAHPAKPDAPVPTPQGGNAPTLRRRLPVAMGLGLVAVAGIGGAVWFGLMGSPATPGTPTQTMAISPASPTVIAEMSATTTRTPSPVRPSATLAPPTATATATPLPGPTATTTPTPRGGGPGEIAYASDQDGGIFQIYLMNADGANARRLTNLPDGACQPEWAPDGQSLLFITPCNRKQEFYERTALWRLTLADLSVAPFVQRNAGVFDADWSLGGLVFTQLDNGEPRLYAANVDGSNIRRLSTAISDDSNASWAPDGSKLVYLNTSRASTPLLYWMNADGTFGGSGPKQVTRDQTIPDPDPAWSPNGELVAYVVGQHIWVIAWDAVGFGAVQLTQKGPNADPAWSPDGNWMAFESWRDAANHDLYIMTMNGGLQTRLTSSPATEMQPAWRP